MASRTGSSHVVTTKRTYNGKVYCTHLLRRSYREDGKVKNQTLSNLSHLPDTVIDLIRRSLKGETFVSADASLEICASRSHGHVQAVQLAMKHLGLASLLASKPCPERDLVQAMVASRILCPATKLATTRLWHTSTLAQEFDVVEATEDDLYAAMDWLLAGQDRIQKKLAARHLKEDSLVLYDLSSSYFEGSHCPLAKLGYSRDGKRGTLQVNYGLLTDGRGCPVAISVHPGNTSDSTTFLPEVKRLREQFGIQRMVMVGDRGMISQKAIDEMSQDSDIDWVTALRSASIRTLVQQGHLQMGLFDERNLLEISSPDFPGERLLACRNPELAKLRAHTRDDLLLATEKNLQKIRARVATGKLAGKDKIGVAVGKVINQYKVAIFEAEVALRQQVAANYANLFASLRAPDPSLRAQRGNPPLTPPYIEPHNTSVYAQYTIRVQDREVMKEKLKAAGIPTAVHYPIPLNKQPAVADPAAKLPVGDEVAQQVLSLPMHPYLDCAQLSEVVSNLTC